MQVLILDRAHAVLLEDGRLPVVRAAGDRPLLAVLARFAAAGVTLPSPAGSRVNGAGRDLVFVVDRFSAPPGMAWRPLRELAADDDVWSLYVACLLGGWVPPTRDLDVWSFGNQPEMAARLVHLVACGVKRVTMGWTEAALRSGTPLARDGGISVVTDGFGYPRVALRTTEVRDVPFGEIDAAAAAGEGEGDLSYGDWREGHIAYFAGEAARYQLEFREDSVIAVERFEVLHVIGRADR